MLVLSGAYLTDDAIQCPAFVQSCDLLPHCSEETLRIEETSDPEHFWSAMITPTLELTISLKQLCVPEP